MSARPLQDVFGVVCSTVNQHRAAARTLSRGRRFSREGAAFALRLEERVAVLHEELSSGSYRHGSYMVFTVLDPKARLIAARSRIPRLGATGTAPPYLRWTQRRHIARLESCAGRN